MRQCLAMIMVLISISLWGQKTITTISFQLSVPQQEYKRTYPVTGAGIRWSVMHRPSADVPLSIGGELGFVVTSTDSKYFDLYYLGYYDRYRITASNNIATIAFKTRADLVPNPSRIQVFVDATIGTNLFFSSVDIERETFFGNSQYSGGRSTKGRWAFIWGPGAGLEIPVGKRKEMAIAFRTAYLFGTNTRYLTDPYIDNNGTVYFTERESKTDMLIIEAGVRIGIFNNRKRDDH
jgi:hypothetical protein